MKLIVFILIMLLLGLQYRLWIGDGGIAEIWVLKGKIIEQQQNNEFLQLRNKLLKAEVTDLKKGLAAIEERARMNLGMIKKGETFYRLIEIPKKQASISD